MAKSSFVGVNIYVCMFGVARPPTLKNTKKCSRLFEADFQLVCTAKKTFCIPSVPTQKLLCLGADRQNIFVSRCGPPKKLLCPGADHHKKQVSSAYALFFECPPLPLAMQEKCSNTWPSSPSTCADRRRPLPTAADHRLLGVTGGVPTAADCRRPPPTAHFSPHGHFFSADRGRLTKGLGGIKVVWPKMAQTAPNGP